MISFRIKKIVAKASHGQRYPMPLCECMWMCDGERGSGPEGADDLCLASMEALGWDLSLNMQCPLVHSLVCLSIVWSIRPWVTEIWVLRGKI